MCGQCCRVFAKNGFVTPRITDGLEKKSYINFIPKHKISCKNFKIKADIQHNLLLSYNVLLIKYVDIHMVEL